MYNSWQEFIYPLSLQYYYELLFMAGLMINIDCSLYMMGRF